MLARVWGCRGSLAAPDPTPCGTAATPRAWRCAPTRSRASCSTRARASGRSDAALATDRPPSSHLLLTHLHMDHLQGLGFFRPLFDPGVEVQVWGPASPVQSLAERIAIYLSPPLFPVRLDDIPSRVTFHDATEEPLEIGSITVRAANVAHQGPTVGFRLEEGERSFVYLPTTSRRSGSSSPTSPPTWISGYGLARECDVLLHDAQYGDHEYPNHVGWGHSSARARDASSPRRRDARARRALPPRSVPHRRRARSPARRHAQAVDLRRRARASRTRA